MPALSYEHSWAWATWFTQLADWEIYTEMNFLLLALKGNRNIKSFYAVSAPIIDLVYQNLGRFS